MNRTICEEAEGCQRFAGEFPWSMSDFKPGEQECQHSMCSRAVKCSELRRSLVRIAPDRIAEILSPCPELQMHEVSVFYTDGL